MLLQLIPIPHCFVINTFLYGPLCPVICSTKVRTVGRPRVWWYEVRDEGINIWSSVMQLLTLSPRKAEKPALPTVTNFRKAEIPAWGSLIYSRKDEISAWKFRKRTVKNNVVSGSSTSGDPMLWELRGERLNLWWLRLTSPWFEQLVMCCISQGSVITPVRRGGQFCCRFIQVLADQKLST